MAIIDCTCLGKNPNCERCFGRGYYDPEIINNITPICFSKEKIEIHNGIPFEEIIKKLSKKEIIILISKLEKKIKFNSKQMRIIKNPKIRNQYEKEKNEMQRKLEIAKGYAMSIGIKVVDSGK